jgi:1-acyl-sn-glycerol-3-phosphate acyltransferase
MQLIGSFLFTAFLFVCTALYAVLLLLVGPFLPFPRRFAMARQWSYVLLAVLKALCRLDYRVEGRENIPPGCHVALIKHSSAWETFGQLALLPPHVWVLKRELSWVPILGWALALMRSIPIDRGSGHLAVNRVVEQGKARLAEGEWLVIFPEGTRMPPGQTRRYGISGALLATQVGCKVVPVAHNAGYFWPRRGLYKKPGTIRVVIGPPIEAAGRDPREVNAEAQAWIEAHSGPPAG